MRTVLVGVPGWARLAHAGAADEIGATAFVLAALWTGWAAWSRLSERRFRAIPRAGAWALLGIATALLVAAAFVPRVLWGPTGPAPGPRPSSPARLAIASPAAGTTVPGPEVVVRIDLRDGAIVGTTTTAVRPDQGHIHLLLDGELIDMTYDGEPVRLDELSPGPHEIEAEFVAADHAPFSPRVRASTAFVVGGAAITGGSS